MTQNIDEVVASFHRARESGGLFDTFYDLLLAKSPAIPPLFAHTDFPHQKRMLRESLLEMLLAAQMTTPSEEVQRLAVWHRELGITAPMYELWLDSLCEALAQHDPRFSPELEVQWRNAMRPGLNAMIAQAPR